MFFIWFGVCFICFTFRTVFNFLSYKKFTLAENKIIVTFIYIVMAILWFSWFQMCFADLVRMSVPGCLRYLGLSFFIIGVFLFIFSHMKLKGFEDRGKLVTSGIYSKIRNPMYFGFILWVIGFPVLTQSLLSLASSVIWISHIVYWKILEERELEKKYEGYREYKKKTWF